MRNSLESNYAAMKKNLFRIKKFNKKNSEQAV